MNGQLSEIPQYEMVYKMDYICKQEIKWLIQFVILPWV